MNTKNKAPAAHERREKPPRRLSGTYEWAVTNVNIDDGCEHGCRYCYARYTAVDHYKRLTQQQWDNPVTKQGKVELAYRKKYDGWVMFPSTHDITPRNIDACCVVLGKLLAAGNKVLIVSKPHIDCIRRICGEFGGFKDNILFRFTIGSTRDEVLKFWEPGAPGFEERLRCLKVAYELGFNTSVSCEPYLDERPDRTYMVCRPFVTESFWIGMLRRFDSRVVLDGVTDEQIDKFVKPLKFLLMESWVKAIYKALDGKPLIKWKDSIASLMRREVPRSGAAECPAQAPRGL